MDFLSVVFVPFIWKTDPCSEANFVGHSFLMADQNLLGESALSLRISWWYLLLHLLIGPVPLLCWRLYVDQSCSQLVLRAFLSKPSLKFISRLTSWVNHGHSHPLTFFSRSGACLSIHCCKILLNRLQAVLTHDDAQTWLKFMDSSSSQNNFWS